MDPKKFAFMAAVVAAAREAMHAFNEVTLDDALGTIGLERRRPVGAKLLFALGLVGVGVAGGAGAALLLAPTSGTELRTSLNKKLGPAKKRLSAAVSEATGEAKSEANKLASPAHTHARAAS